jgi:hypothetical protein
MTFKVKRCDDCHEQWFDPNTSAELVEWTKAKKRGVFRGMRHGIMNLMECAITEFEISGSSMEAVMAQ